MSLDELKSVISATLESRGVLAKLKAELRSHVFQAIEEQEGAAKPPATLHPALETIESNPAELLLLSLIRESLEFYQFDFSLSTFNAETRNQLEKPNNPMKTRKMLAESLHLNDKSGKPLLVEMIQQFQQGKSSSSSLTGILKTGTLSLSQSQSQPQPQSQPSHSQSSSVSSLSSTSSLAKPKVSFSDSHDEDSLDFEITSKKSQTQQYNRPAQTTTAAAALPPLTGPSKLGALPKLGPISSSASSAPASSASKVSSSVDDFEASASGGFDETDKKALEDLNKKIAAMEAKQREDVSDGGDDYGAEDFDSLDASVSQDAGMIKRPANKEFETSKPEDDIEEDIEEEIEIEIEADEEDM